VAAYIETLQRQAAPAHGQTAHGGDLDAVFLAYRKRSPGHESSPARPRDFSRGAGLARCSRRGVMVPHHPGQSRHTCRSLRPLPSRRDHRAAPDFYVISIRGIHSRGQRGASPGFQLDLPSAPLILCTSIWRSVSFSNLQTTENRRL
jgi:hypothetical protein